MTIAEQVQAARGNKQQQAATSAPMPSVEAQQTDVKTDTTPIGYKQVQQNQVQQGQSATNAQSSGTSSSTSERQQQKTYDADAQRAAIEQGQDYINGAPSAYNDELDRLGLGENGARRNELDERLKAGVPFSQAVQDVAMSGQKEELEKAKKLAKTRNTMANAMSAFQLVVDMASGFSGGNIYKRDGNDKIAAQNKADVAAAENKYQKAVDEFNANMRSLQKDDLTEKRRRAAQLGEVGFGSKGTTSSTGETSNTQSSATASTSSSSQNQFLSDAQYHEQMAMNRAALAHGGKDKTITLLGRVVDKDGKVSYYKKEDVQVEQFDKVIAPTISNDLTAIANNPKYMNNPNSPQYKAIYTICTQNNLLDADGKPDVTALKDIVNGKYKQYGIEKEAVQGILLSAYKNLQDAKSAASPITLPKGTKTNTEQVPIERGVTSPTKVVKRAALLD